ncbi:uncharacterized protein LOC133188166 [Saccostrea echinata]|uniref:uncharacterized protein LOC133188166 n=1 Tax=Saccostrea echinata TaxID=191078 RepID=UPI002A837FA3|nr:uncharacterized protein LOC133188166 [Saccostrea echinata]
MGHVKFLLSLLFCLGVNSLKYIPQHCQIVSSTAPCVCKDEYGNFVDLRPLAWKNFTARYQDRTPADGDNNHMYSWNPCYGFVEKSTNDTSGCINVASCRENKIKTEFLDIGIQNGATFGHFDNGNLSITYNSRDGKRTTIVSLYCNEEQEDSTLRAVGNMGSFFWLQLRSKYCCPRKREDISSFTRHDFLPSFNLFEMENTTEEPHLPTIPSPSVVTVTSQPGPDLHEITFLLTGILIVSFLIMLILVGGLFWKCIRRNPYAQYSLISNDDFVENKRQTY